MHPDKQSTIQNLKLLFGELDQSTASEILALEPSLIELEQASLWLNGGGDILARNGQRQSEKVRAILDILDTNDDER